MIDTCLINKLSGCSRLTEINSIKKSNKVILSYAFDWNTHSDTSALIFDLYYYKLKSFASELGIELDFQVLGGKQTGSIYCDICCEIQKSDIILFDISSHNINVLFELGLAIGSGAFVYILRSKHQKTPTKNFSDLNGILEYRFTRSKGILKFENDLIGDLMLKLKYITECRGLKIIN